MTPARFIELAQIIAGRYWKTALPKLIGKSRSYVWEYANGKRDIPATVRILMEQLGRNV